MSTWRNIEEGSGDQPAEPSDDLQLFEGMEQLFFMLKQTAGRALSTKLGSQPESFLLQCLQGVELDIFGEVPRYFLSDRGWKQLEP